MTWVKAAGWGADEDEVGSPRHAAAPARPDARGTRRLALVLPIGLVVVAALMLALVVLPRSDEAVRVPAAAVVPSRGAAAPPGPAAALTPSTVLAAASAEDAAVDVAIRAAVVEQQRVQRLRDAAARKAARWNRRHGGSTAGVRVTASGGTAAAGVWVVGDSIAAGIGAAWPGNPVVVAVPGAHSSTVVPRAVPALSAAAGRPVTVVALGTNDDPTKPEAFRADVRALLAAAPGCTVWTTIHQPGGRWEALNAVLREESAHSSGRLQLADWDALATAHPDLLQPDGIHPRTGTVYSSIVALAEQAASRCR